MSCNGGSSSKKVWGIVEGENTFPLGIAKTSNSEHGRKAQELGNQVEGMCLSELSMEAEPRQRLGRC